MCEFQAASHATQDSGVPKPLRQAIRRRRNLATVLQSTIVYVVTPQAFRLIDRIAEINRSLRSREWLPPVAGFDPIALGM